MRLNKAQREQVRMMFDGHCAYCGCELGERWHADHVEAVHRYIAAGVPTMVWPDKDELKNLMPACIPCNIDKATFGLNEWRKQIANRIAVLNRNVTAYRFAKAFGLVQETGAAIVFYFERPPRRTQG